MQTNESFSNVDNVDTFIFDTDLLSWGIEKFVF